MPAQQPEVAKRSSRWGSCTQSALSGRFSANPPASWVHAQAGLLGRGCARPGCRMGVRLGEAADGETGVSSLGQFVHSPACMQVLQNVSRRPPLGPHSKADVVPSPLVLAPGWLAARHTPRAASILAPLGLVDCRLWPVDLRCFCAAAS